MVKTYLLPRRSEIVNIVKDHPYVSADEIARRFPMTPKRTVSYDINYLVRKEHIKKHGATRGVRYSV
jgi:DeoR/GlpR family transcriptional regulator of sugar metabolism